MLFVCYMGIAQASVIGKPIRLQKFVVAQHDFPTMMSWDDATAACAKLGDGWRLPTKDELNLLYENKDKIGGFKDKVDGFKDGNFWCYWSSTNYIVFEESTHWYQNFISGSGVQFETTIKESEYNVRAVRSL